MNPEIVGLAGIVCLVVLLALGMYIGMAMALIGFLGLSILVGMEAGVHILGITPLAEGSSYTLSVIPLFVLMGQFAFISGISSDIYKTVYAWMGHFRGGLAMATVMACAGFAAVCGSSLATGATMGMVAIPEMDKYKYDPRLSTGCVAAGGTLGILIPPSIGFIIYGILTEESIGKLFMAGFLPGILLAGLFIIAIYIQCLLRPQMGPPGDRTNWKTKFKSLGGTWGMLLLFCVVMGGIYFGVFTPTEAAGFGAFGAFLFALFKRKLSVHSLIRCLLDVGKTTAMIFIIIIGANIFRSGEDTHGPGRFHHRPCPAENGGSGRNHFDIHHPGMHHGLLRHHDPDRSHYLSGHSGHAVRSHLVWRSNGHCSGSRADYPSSGS